VSKNISTYSRFGRYAIINQEYCFIDITTVFYVHKIRSTSAVI